jgi:hypothetical protein
VEKKHKKVDKEHKKKRKLNRKIIISAIACLCLIAILIVNFRRDIESKAFSAVANFLIVRNDAIAENKGQGNSDANYPEEKKPSEKSSGESTDKADQKTGDSDRKNDASKDTKDTKDTTDDGKTEEQKKEEAFVKEREEGHRKDEYKVLLQNLFDSRNQAILDKDEKLLRSIYDTDKRFGLWAYEHEENKMKYLENWSGKQGVNFKTIKTNVKVSNVKEKDKNIYGIICSVSTDYAYSYKNQQDKLNTFRIGTEHYLNVKVGDKGELVITKEWYTDPFADSLSLDKINSDDIMKYIASVEAPEVAMTDEQKKGVEYAHKYAGIAAEGEESFNSNSNYRNLNPDGGDCANFASQIMFESGKFKKNQTWNYYGDSGTKAWVNAQGFKNYMLNSGRGSLIAKGKYEEIYKEAYNLRPGDIVAYEKNGRITHVSTVTGMDTRGYPLVTCHNTDRLLVPWDLGWSDKKISFHLIKVNY